MNRDEGQRTQLEEKKAFRILEKRFQKADAVIFRDYKLGRMRK